MRNERCSINHEKALSGLNRDQREVAVGLHRLPHSSAVVSRLDVVAEVYDRIGELEISGGVMVETTPK